MRKVIFGLLFIGLASQLSAQIIAEEKLSEVVVTAVNYKYLNAVDNTTVSVPVKAMQQKVSNYNIKENELYSDEYDTYTVSFYVPKGRVVAAYDTDGTILRSIERYEDAKLPRPVLEAVAKRFPNWEISKDVYLVKYHEDKGIVEKYKFLLRNGSERVRVKTDGDGNFL